MSSERHQGQIKYSLTSLKLQEQKLLKSCQVIVNKDEIRLHGPEAGGNQCIFFEQGYELEENMEISNRHIKSSWKNRLLKSLQGIEK